MRGIVMKIKISRVILKEGYKDCDLSMVYPGFLHNDSLASEPSDGLRAEVCYFVSVQEPPMMCAYLSKVTFSSVARLNT